MKLKISKVPYSILVYSNNQNHQHHDLLPSRVSVYALCYY